MSELDIETLSIYYPAHHEETLLEVIDNSGVYNTPDFALLNRSNARIYQEGKAIVKYLSSEMRRGLPYDLSRLSVKCGTRTGMAPQIRQQVLESLAEALYFAIETAAPIMDDVFIGPMWIKELKFLRYEDVPLHDSPGMHVDFR